ncbi:MAG: tyrosine-type recombinase/integrase [Candidatus Dormibacteria bacterium]
MAKPKSKVANVEVRGPLAPFADPYRLRLEESGYTPLTIVNQLRQVTHLSRWMQASHLAPTDLTAVQIEEFLRPRRVAKGSRACSSRGLLPMLEVLTEQGLLLRDSPSISPHSTHEATLAQFRTYLLAERGLAACTTDAYVARARQFLDRHADDADLTLLTVGDVTGAVRREAMRVSIGSTQYFVASLRAFLRFCFLEGLVGTDLSAAALAVTGRRGSLLPKGITGADAAALLRACDRRHPDGRRNYAVILLLLRLGLRASEAAGLTLDDINWRAGEILVRGKGRREDRLPLPADVGEAIGAYLRRGRPSTTQRVLFLRAIAPLGPLGRGGVSDIVRRACRRAGVPPVGAHCLRHTLACALVAADVPLPQIGELLRHRGITSTAIYARVDRDALRSLAQAWPVGDA